MAMRGASRMMAVCRNEAVRAARRGRARHGDRHSGVGGSVVRPRLSCGRPGAGREAAGGIDVYDNLPAHEQLRKAVNDARAVGAALTELGFEVAVEENVSASPSPAPGSGS